MTNYPSDEDIARQLELLADRVDQIMTSAGKMLAEAKSFEAVRELLAETRQCQSQTQEVKRFYDENRLDKLQEAMEYLQKLGISEDLVDRLNDILQQTLFQSQQTIESERELKEFNQSFAYTKQFLEALEEKYQVWSQALQQKYSQWEISLNEIGEKIDQFNQIISRMNQDITKILDFSNVVADLRERTNSCFDQLSMLESVESLLLDASALKLSVDASSSALAINIKNAELLCGEINNKKVNILEIANDVTSAVSNLEQQAKMRTEELRKVTEELTDKIDVGAVRSLVEEVRQASVLLQEARENLGSVKSLEQQIATAQAQMKQLDQMVVGISQDIYQIRDLLEPIAELQNRVDRCISQLSMLQSIESLLVDARRLKSLLDNGFSELLDGLKKIEQAYEEMDTKKLTLLQTFDEIDSKIKPIQNEAQNTIDELKMLAEELGGKATVEDVRNLLKEVKQTRALLHEAKADLLAVRSLEQYIRDFHYYRDHGRLKYYLRRELGWLGLFIYFLHLILPKRQR